MPLDIGKYAETEQVATVHLPSGDSFDFGFYPAKLTREWHLRLRQYQEEETEEDAAQVDEIVTELFAWWDILEDGERWPVDAEHFRRLPGPVFAKMMDALTESVEAEGKVSAST